MLAQSRRPLQGVIEKLKIERVDKAFRDAQKNIAAGWAPCVEQLRLLEKAADTVGRLLTGR